ncbi:MAG: ribonuclease H-like domain-containing protein [Chitinophagaceae bacterium]
MRSGKMQLRGSNRFILTMKSRYWRNLSTRLCQLRQQNNNWCFTGHNIKEFDIPFLCRRTLVNNISIPACFNLQAMKTVETCRSLIRPCTYGVFGDYKHYTSLKLLAAALGVPSPKNDIDGSKVGEVYWTEKDSPRIALY